MGRDYAGKSRPVVILQDDRFDATASVAVCASTTNTTDVPLFRLAVEPRETNGLRVSGRLMVDKITTVSRAKIGTHLGVSKTRTCCGSIAPYWCSSASREPRSAADLIMREQVALPRARDGIGQDDGFRCC